MIAFAVNRQSDFNMERSAVMTESPENMKHERRTGKDPAVFIIPLMIMMLFLLIHSANGTKLLSPSYYNSYTRQAMSWREGYTHLENDVSYLELAVYDGEYYVSFPPVPAAVEYIVSEITGFETPDNLLMLLYSVTSYECLYFVFRKKGKDGLTSAVFAFSVCCAGCILTISTSGCVWYHAQILGFMLLCLSLAFFVYGRMTPSLIAFALSVGCRPMNALFGVLLIVLWYEEKRKSKTPFMKSIRALLPGLICGLIIAAVYAVYNAVRFGNIFEFGHNWLPEFSFQGGTQFSLSHVAQNIRKFIFGMPFSISGERLNSEQFGFSMLLASPVFILMLMRSAKAIGRRRNGIENTALLVLFALQLLLLLMHRTFGGYQFGARYTCDLLPYAAVCFMLSRDEMSHTETVITFIAFAFSLYGAFAVALA